jgi:hypothetical protein
MVHTKSPESNPLGIINLLRDAEARLFDIKSAYDVIRQARIHLERDL